MNQKKTIGIPGYKGTDSNNFGVGNNYLSFCQKLGYNPRIIMPWEEYVEVDMLLLPGGMDISPVNYDSIPGRLVLLYKSNGYLEVPKRVTATRCNMLFSTNDNDNMNLNSWAAKKLTLEQETKSKQETDW